MSFSSPHPSAAMLTTSLFLILIITYLSLFTIAQPNLPITPTITECGPRILPLATCAPFVQGLSTEPSQMCCDNLKRVNDQQPLCLCILLNNSALSSTFPINTTLAMQLPLICSVNFDIASCTGSPSPSMPPMPQVSLGSITNTTTNSTTNSTVASSPMTSTTAVTPKAGVMGLGYYHPNYTTKFKGSFQLRLTVVLAILTCLSTSILC